MPQKAAEKPARKSAENTAEGFAASVLKYSVSTFVNMGILGLSIILTGVFIVPDVLEEISIFTTWTNTIMTIAVLGLDQAFLRFYNNPPARLTQNGLFRLCFYGSSAALLLAGTLCSTLLLGPVYGALGFSMAGPQFVPLLFLNAFFYLIARYFNVYFRMRGNILWYTAESILMQFFYKLFFILGAFMGTENPAPAMMLCSLGGLCIFAVFFCIFKRRVLHPRRADFTGGGYKTLLPYGLAVAPTAVFVTANLSVALSMLVGMAGEAQAGMYSFAYTLSNVVSMVQLGFAAYWGPYMYAHYKTQQPRIMRVHDYLNLLILAFFTLLVAFQDAVGLFFPKYAGVLPIFPLMMLSAVFTILCETTVYGIAIAKRPIWDTVGIGLSFAVNVGGIVLLVPSLGLHGAAIGLAAANFIMFMFRTLIAQRFYRSIQSYGRTALAVALATALAAGGTLLAGQFWPKLALCAAALAAFCLLYRRQLARLWRLGVSMVFRGRKGRET